jgi:transposase-like protein
MNEVPTELTELQEEILNGHMLGDGCLRINKKSKCINAQFTVHRQTADIDYFWWTVKHFENYIYEPVQYNNDVYNKNLDKIIYSVRFQTKASPIFTEYYNKWYPEGKKIVSRDFKLTPLILAVWFCDDGSLSKSRLYDSLKLRFSTDGFSYDDVVWLHQQLCDLYGENIHIYPVRPNQFCIQSSNKDIIYNFVEDIYPVMPPMERKLIRAKESAIFNDKKYNINYIVPVINFLEKEIREYPPCKHCGSTSALQDGYYKKGVAKYLCKDCNKHYMAPEDYYISESNPPCYRCGSNNSIKNGRNKQGDQLYRCNECNKQYHIK